VLLIANSFMNHNNVLVLVRESKLQNVLFILVGHGRPGQTMAALDKHKTQLAELRAMIPKPKALPPPTPIRAPVVTPTPTPPMATEPPVEPVRAAIAPILGADSTPNSAAPKHFATLEDWRNEHEAKPGIRRVKLWNGEELYWLHKYRSEGMSMDKTIDVIKLKSGRIASAQAISNAYWQFFGQGRSRLKTKGMKVLIDFETFKRKMDRVAAAPIPLATKPDPAPATVNTPVQPEKAAAPAKIAIVSKGDGNMLIEISGPHGSSIIETRRTLGEIVSWLMGA
jgi:hypothetical protein